MSLGKLWELVMDREVWLGAVHEVTKSQTQLSNWTELSWRALKVSPDQTSAPLLVSWSSCTDFIVQFSSVAQLCLTLWDPMDCSTPDLPVHHQLPELTQTHVHPVGDSIQLSHPLSSPFPPAFNLSQHQDLFQWIGSLHQVAKVLELQHQSLQWIFRVDFL